MNSAGATSSNDGSPSTGPVKITVDCPDVQVVKTADNGTISAGDTAAFTIVVTNNGPGVAKHVTLTDTLPVGVDWQEDNADCSITASVLSCDFGDLASGATRTIHVSGKTDATDCGTRTNGHRLGDQRVVRRPGQHESAPTSRSTVPFRDEDRG